MFVLCYLVMHDKEEEEEEEEKEEEEEEGREERRFMKHLITFSRFVFSLSLSHWIFVYLFIFFGDISVCFS